MARNYRKEYDNYQGKPEQIKRRVMRDKARRAMQKAGLVEKGSGMDVDHKDSDPNNNSRANLRVIPKEKNRSFARTKTAREKRK